VAEDGWPSSRTAGEPASDYRQLFLQTALAVGLSVLHSDTLLQVGQYCCVALGRLAVDSRSRGHGRKRSSPNAVRQTQLIDELCAEFAAALPELVTGVSPKFKHWWARDPAPPPAR